MRSTSSASIASSLNKICPSTVTNLQIRRKYKTDRHGKEIRWWFLIKGDESTLKKLEDEWEAVELQTPWKLEMCTKFVDPAIEEEPLASASSIRPATPLQVPLAPYSPSPSQLILIDTATAPEAVLPTQD